MRLQLAALSWALIARTCLAQNYYFTGAICIAPSPNNPSAAVPAQCPASNPVTCSAISEPSYCCPTNNYCAWAGSVVACCPNGQTCSGSVSGPNAYQPSSWYQQPTTYYVPPPTPVVTAPVVVVPPQYVTTQYVTQYQPKPSVVYGGYYCSTLVANGPNLPTTAQGNCGTILVIAPSDAARVGRKYMGMGLLVVFLHVLGGVLLGRR